MRFVIAMLMYCLGSASAQACSCARTTPEERFDGAPLVFVARVTQVEDVALEPDWRMAQRAEHDEDWEPTEGVDYGLRMRFEIEAVIKGDPSRLVTLITGYGGGDCGIPVMPGGTLVVATDNKGYVGFCSYSHVIRVHDCVGVLELEQLRQRARDGKSALVVPAASEVADAGRRVFEELVEGGRNPYSLTTEECPVRLNPSERSDAVDEAEAESE